jgi:subtilase family serine protease
VNFTSPSQTSATLTITVPQGAQTIQISSYLSNGSGTGACTGSGGQGTVGTGQIISQFVGTGTVSPTSTDIGTVFNGGTGISLAPFLEPTTFGFTATAIASTFQYPEYFGYNGSNETVAIVIDTAPLSTDYGAYLSFNQVPTTSRTITAVSVNSASTSPNTSSASFGEATLDTETIAGLAPGANIRVYVVPGLDDIDLVDAYSQIESDLPNGGVVSMSYGGCEPTVTNSSESAAFAAGVAQKLAFVASSGDQGSTCYDNGTQVPGVNAPASDPNVIGVGGNSSYYDGTNYTPTLTRPVAWNDEYFGDADGTGGGPSSTFPIQTWQSGISGRFSSTYRNVPDIAMPAEGTAIYLNGTWEQYGGTSWSAPEVAAMIAELDEYCGGPLANPQEIPYIAYQQNHNAFIDITSGNNLYSPTAGSISYSAGTGFDDTTGFGLPLGMQVAQAVCPGGTPLTPLAAPALANVTLAVAQPLTFAARPLVGTASDAGPKNGSDTVTVQLGLRLTANAAANQQTVVTTLQNAGFTVTHAWPNHVIVDATGPSSLVASFFSTTLHNVTQGTYANRYAAVGSVTIPAALAPYVAGVTLDNVVRMHDGPHRRS